MAQTGTLVVRVSTSTAQLPVADATVVVYDLGEDGRRNVHSIQITDSSGGTAPIQLDAPDYDLSQSPGSPLPFASYGMLVEHPDYYVAFFEQLQIFSGVETVQNVSLSPLPQPNNPENDDSAPPVIVTPQPL